ncbi:hypothetical protein VZF83_06685 [Synechococcus elongatus IITB3]|uniref:phasin family protein n=2 Tax=Synechococcus elongatus TaxID=32046 RepID=UPI0030CC7B40
MSPRDHNTFRQSHFPERPFRPQRPEWQGYAEARRPRAAGMSTVTDLLQKAVYLGIGLASYVPELAKSENLSDLSDRVQKLVDDLVARGEMTTEEAKQAVEELVRQAQGSVGGPAGSPPPIPQPIQITVEEVEPEANTSASSTPADSAPPSNSTSAADDLESLRQQVSQLREELNRLNQNKG